MKKLMCVLLALALVLGLLPAAVAEESAIRVGIYLPVDEEKGTDNEDVKAVAKMISLCDGEAVMLNVPVNETAAAGELAGVDCLVFVCGESLLQNVPDGAIAEERELALIKAALANGMPVLAIDRGMLVLNEALGGLTNALSLDGDTDGVHTSAIVFDNENYMGMVLGGIGSYTVDAKHNAFIERLSNALTATAIAEDGTVEAYEQAEGGEQMLIGVLFRPERLVLAGQEEYLGLFRLIIETAEINKNAAIPDAGDAAIAIIGGADGPTEVFITEAAPETEEGTAKDGSGCPFGFGNDAEPATGATTQGETGTAPVQGETGTANNDNQAPGCGRCMMPGCGRRAAAQNDGCACEGCEGAGDTCTCNGCKLADPKTGACACEGCRRATADKATTVPAAPGKPEAPAKPETPAEAVKPEVSAEAVKPETPADGKAADSAEAPAEGEETSLGDKVAKLANDVKEYASSLTGEAKELLNDVGEDLSVLAKELGSEAEELYNSVTPEVQKLWDEISPEISGWLSSIFG